MCIRDSGYTEQEKVEIAKQFLVKKQMVQAGLTEKNIKFSDEAIAGLIRSYTREAGAVSYTHLDVYKRQGHDHRQNPCRRAGARRAALLRDSPRRRRRAAGRAARADWRRPRA